MPYRPPPVTLARPYNAPPGCKTLLESIDIVGEAIDPDWTGSEPLAGAVQDKTTVDFDLEALEIASREWNWDRENSRSRMEIQTELEGEYQQHTALRKRRQAVVNELRTMLFEGTVVAKVFAVTGEEFEVPRHIWAADGAEEIFDTGVVNVVDRAPRFRKGLCRGDECGIVMIDEVDLRRAIRGEETVVAARPEPDPYRTGGQGRPSIIHLVSVEFDRRVGDGKTYATIKQASLELAKWAREAHPTAPPLTAKTVENRIRTAFNAAFPKMPLK